MHKDFHLYGTYLAARLAGFEQNGARDIACAAQAVDDFTYGEYGSCAGTDMAFTVRKEAKDILQTLWTTFHFLPVLENVTDKLNKEEKEKKFRTAPCGAFFDRLSTDLQSAFSGNENTEFKWAMAGVTMHVLADCFAHQGFSGLMSGTNTVENVRADMGGNNELGLGVLTAPRHVPTMLASLEGIFSIGHGTAGHFPDISWLYYKCQYKQDSSISGWGRINSLTFAIAFGKMIEVLHLLVSGLTPPVSKEKLEEIQNIINSTYTGIESVRSKKLDDYASSKSSDIAEEKNDTVFQNFMSSNFYKLGDAYTPTELANDYTGYINHVNDKAKRCKEKMDDIVKILNQKDAPESRKEAARKEKTGMEEDPFLNATVWHRENVMTEIWKKFPDFPSSLKINPA